MVLNNHFNDWIYDVDKELFCHNNIQAGLFVYVFK